MERIDRIAGCLLGGAVGDALGAPVEFMSIERIRAQYGAHGIQRYAPAYGRLGAITDDTQMTLFTLEGILRTVAVRNRKGITSTQDCVLRAYLRWLGTQGIVLTGDEHRWLYDGWLWRQQELHARRGPGNTCLSSLREHLRLIEGRNGDRLEGPINESKGCGGVMRMAPVGFFDVDNFAVGCDLAMLTHGHPSGYLAAGFLAHVIGRLIAGSALGDAVESASCVLVQWPEHHEVLRAVEQALACARDEEASPETIGRLGGGWVAEEALAVAVFCALKADGFAHGVRLAVNHGGDSDSTGAITGNILGAMLGRGAIPAEFLEELELREVIERMANDVVTFDDTDQLCERYPGH